jgi:hypothetical protein
MARMPPWILGFRVFTLPSRISGKPVIVEISEQSIPLSFKVFEVPPLDMIFQFNFFKPWAKSVIPLLFETLINAVGIFFSFTYIVKIIRKEEREKRKDGNGCEMRSAMNPSPYPLPQGERKQ